MLKGKTPLKLETQHLNVRTELESKGCTKSLQDKSQRLSLNSLCTKPVCFEVYGVYNPGCAGGFYQAGSPRLSLRVMTVS